MIQLRHGLLPVRTPSVPGLASDLSVVARIYISTRQTDVNAAEQQASFKHALFVAPTKYRGLHGVGWSGAGQRWGLLASEQRKGRVTLRSVNVLSPVLLRIGVPMTTPGI